MKSQLLVPDAVNETVCAVGERQLSSEQALTRKTVDVPAGASTSLTRGQHWCCGDAERERLYTVVTNVKDGVSSRSV